jgi:hypothetical protein
MKLPKPLLSAILIGVAVQAGTSCKKQMDDSNREKKETIIQKVIEQKKTPTFNCPACGMG